MKNFVITITLLLISFIGKSQKYTPFDLSSGRWDCGYFTKGGFFDSYGIDYVREEVRFYCQGDTLINDTIFKKLYFIGYAKPTMTPQKNISGYYGAIRNDSINKRVWLKNEYRYDILYDFNIKIGDSYGYSCSEPEATIYSIDSVLYCDRFHRRYNYKDVQNYNQYIIEGIGSSDGLIPVNCLTSFSYLICYSEKNNIICDTCEIPITLIKENKTIDIQIYPNPTNKSINIVSKVPIFSIEIIDLQGRLIYYSNRNIDKMEINIEQNGIFIIKIETSDKIILNKFINY